MAHADLVQTDLLAGIGDFTKSTYTLRYGGDQYGEPSLPDDTVADGWQRIAPASSSFVCNLTKLPGYQYLALKNISSGSGNLVLRSEIRVGSGRDRVQPGDTVTFTVDKVRMLDWSESYGSELRVSIVNGANDKKIDYNSNEFSISYTQTIPSGATNIAPCIRLSTWGNLGSHQPGVLVAGAHLYITRSGSKQNETENVPVLSNKRIATHNYQWDSNYHGIRDVCSNYDEISTMSWSYRGADALRKLNPDMRVYLYQTSLSTNDTSHETRWAQSPMRFSEIKAQHANWLVPVSPGTPNSCRNANGYVSISGCSDKFILNAATDKDFQSLWVQGVIAKARAVGADGLWIDDCGSMTVENSGFKREMWEVQNYIHAVVPLLKQAGLIVVLNQAEQNLDGTVGWDGNCATILCNPFWTPSSGFPASSGYSPNNSNNTPDVMFQEYSFIRNDNKYDNSYWLKCLSDADIIVQWNAKLSRSDWKRLQYMVLQKDDVSHPAYGLDGWIHFSLASYLLCQNSYTSFGVRFPDGSPYPTVDYSITKRLGDPDGAHQSYNGDQYLRYRRYKATSDGGVGGIVVVNGNASNQKKFVVDMDVVDESGNPISSGTEITLKAMTGRILLRRAGSVDVTITVPTENVFPGQILDVTVEYTNSSGSEARNVVVRANVPDEMNYVNGSAEASDGHYDRATNSVYWTIASLQAAGSGVKTFKVKVK